MPFKLICFHGYSLALSGQIAEGEVYINKSLSQAKKLGHPPTFIPVEIVGSAVCLSKGDGAGTIAHSQEAIKFCATGESDPFLSLAHGFIAGGYYLLEEYEKARPYVEQAIQLQEKMRLSMVSSSLYIVHAWIDLEMQDYKDAETHAEKALQSAQQTSEKHMEAMAWVHYGRILGKKRPVEPEKA